MYHATGERDWGGAGRLLAAEPIWSLIEATNGCANVPLKKAKFTSASGCEGIESIEAYIPEQWNGL